MTSTAAHLSNTLFDRFLLLASIEVVVPLLWALTSLGVDVDLYRDTFRQGSRDALSQWFKGKTHGFSSLIDADLTKIDTIFLANGDRDSARLLQHRLLKKHPHLRVVAIAHQLPHYDASKPEPLQMISTNPDRHFLGEVADYVRAGRWRFAVISPHMSDGLSQLFREQPEVALPEEIVMNATYTFIPVACVRSLSHIDGS